MNIEVIAEHSIDVDLLPSIAYIVDAGCRNMLFTNEMRRRGHCVFALDIDDLGNEDYLKIALGDKVGRVGIHRTKDPQATFVCAGDEVMCMDLDMLCKTTKVDFFDVIKLDVEGFEFQIIMSMNKPYCKQLSWEAHLHTGVYGEAEVVMMENKLLSLGYFPVKHDKTRQHGLSYNFWDSLWVLV
jgi:hypothetical protein